MQKDRGTEEPALGDSTMPEGDPVSSDAEEWKVSDYIRRIRRRLGVSQRALAARLRVSQSRVAKWETGRTRPRVEDLQCLARMAGLELRLVTSEGQAVEPMRPDAARDRGGRRFPAHLDVDATDTWAGAEVWWLALRRQVHERDNRPRGQYFTGLMGLIRRSLLGFPADHPTQAALQAMVDAHTAGDFERWRELRLYGLDPPEGSVPIAS